MTGNRGSSKWKEIDFIQIVTTYLLPNEKNFYYEFNVYQSTINNKFPLNYSALFQSLDMTSYDEFQKICVSIAYKVAEYITNIAHREIIFMKCDFTKDTIGNIWLHYLYDIKTAPATVNMEELQLAKKVQEIIRLH